MPMQVLAPGNLYLHGIKRIFAHTLKVKTVSVSAAHWLQISQ